MPNRMESLTGIDRDTWRNIRYGKQKVNEDHIEAACNAFPQFRLWLETGRTDPESGQIAPDINIKQEKTG